MYGCRLKRQIRKEKKGEAMMNRNNRWFLTVSLVGAICVFVGWGGQAQSQEKYPTRPIDLIVPYAPGGGTDLAIRIVALYMNKKWGVPVNVLNKPGGNTIPAGLEVFSAKPDGYTLLADGLPSASMLPVVVKNVPFKIMDRSFIAMTTVVSSVMAVPAKHPVNNLKDLEALAKKDPGNFTWASMGGVGSADLNIRQFFMAIDLDVTKTKPVMVQGASQAVTLTAGGHVILGAITTGTAIPAVKGGLVKGLAIASRERWPDLPEVATTFEQGYPGISIEDWKCVSGPPHLPSHVIEVWEKAIQEMVKDSEVGAKFKNIGARPNYHSSRETRENVLREMEEIRKLYAGK
jgi:tripartite-type tricarboxylate transporter receptor subunit TctC